MLGHGSAHAARFEPLRHRYPTSAHTKERQPEPRQAQARHPTLSTAALQTATSSTSQLPACAPYTWHQHTKSERRKLQPAPLVIGAEGCRDSTSPAAVLPLLYCTKLKMKRNLHAMAQRCHLKKSQVNQNHLVKGGV